MSSLDILLKHTPTWVSIDCIGESEVLISADAAPPGEPPRIFRLRLTHSEGAGVSVAEQPEARQLPFFCPERHINPGGSFCLFLRSERPLESQEQTSAWWHALLSYLGNQVYAERFRIWPLESGLCHGSAATLQIEMETIASPLGWRDEILQGLFRAQGWLSDRLPRSSKDQSWVVNGRTACPRGCSKLRRRQGVCRSDSNGVPLSGEKPILRVDCPNRSALERIVLLEHARQRIERDLLSSLRLAGATCCQSMRNCPLSG
jgi:hypothetical protein